jgi:ADP-ribose pyrophosphatase
METGRVIETLASELIYAEPPMTIVRERLRVPSGRELEKTVIHHPGAVVLLPLLDSGRLVMIRQYRQALRARLLEFPAGTREPGEPPRDCAAREIVEETGYAAAELLELGLLHPSPGMCDELQWCFLARELTPQAGIADEDEIIEVVEMTVDQVAAAILDGRITDAKSIAIFTRARLRGLV